MDDRLSEIAPIPASEEIVSLQGNCKGWYGITGIVLAILLALPIWVVTYLPLVDYPNHLARGYLLYHYQDVPSFSENFEIAYLSTPSLAVDLFMVGMQALCDVETAGKLFLTLTLWLWLSGWHMLGWAVHGRPTWLAWGGALFAYHSMLLYGFANFSFGLGMFLWSAAAWISWRESWTLPRLLAMCLLAFGCFFAHLAGYVFLTGTVVVLSSWRFRQNGRIRPALLLGLLPIVLIGCLPVLARLAGIRGNESPPVWNNWQGKFAGAFCLLRGYDRTFDAAFMAATAIFLVLFFVWSTRIKAKGGLLLAGLGCVAMFILAPKELFGGSPADARFLPPASALMVLSLDVSMPRLKAKILLGLFLALVVLRLGMFLWFWQIFDADVREQVALFDRFPRQARVYPIVRIAEQAERQKRDLALFHALHYAVLSRQIYSPQMLAIPGHMPIRHKSKPIFFHDDAESFPALEAVPWERVFAHCDFLWCYHVPDDYRQYLRKYATEIESRNGGSLWRVK